MPEKKEAEFAYNLERERKLEAEKRALAVAAREEQLAARESEMAEKKAFCEARIAEIDALQERVDGIPAQLEGARKAGMKKAESRMNKAYGYEQAINEKDREHRIGALKAQYDRLLEKYAELREEKDDILRRLDECYAQSRVLTSDTVRSIGGINILNGGIGDDRI